MHEENAVVPNVEELLEVDREFRLQPQPVFHTRRDGRRYSVLYSPTSLARRLRRDRDWVVIDLEQEGPNPRWTVVTERRGVLKGKRVVRSRAVVCFWYYRARGRHQAA